MAKSSRGRGGPIRGSATAPRAGGAVRAPSLADLLPRSGSADLESFLAKAREASQKGQAVSAPEYSLGPRSWSVSRVQDRQARRSAAEGARLIASGRPVQAIPLLEQAVRLNPDIAASHHDLGVALTALGRLDEALEPLAAAVRLDPGHLAGRLQLAHVFDMLGREHEAIANYRTAIALKPDTFAAQMRLGEIYLAYGRGVDSAVAFRAAAAAAPGTAMGRIAEARALEASGAVEQAVAAMRAVVDANPELAEAHTVLGLLLAEAGLSAQAAAHYDRATELSPDMLLSWSGLASNKKFTADDGALIARMNAALSRPNLTQRHLTTLNFTLGKAYDDIGNYEAAMRHFEAGNRARALAGRLNREALVRHVDQLIAATPPGQDDRRPHLEIEDPTPILIVGLPRSGSTLTEQILSSHPDVAAAGELAFWGMRESVAAIAGSTQRLAKDYLAALRARGPDAKRVTDKTLSNFMLLGFIARLFPNAVFIHCRRHPIDMALSIFTTQFGVRIEYAADRGDLVFYFRQYQRLMAHWRETLPPGRLIEVDYEALVADPEPQTRRLIAACGLAWNDACLSPHRNTRSLNTASIWQARQPIYRTSVERWRRYEPWLGELRELAPAD